MRRLLLIGTLVLITAISATSSQLGEFVSFSHVDGSEQEHVEAETNIDDITSESMSRLREFENALDKRTTSKQESTGLRLYALSSHAEAQHDSLSVSDTLGGVFLQAPHQYADKYTGDVLLSLMASNYAVDATFINSRHRRLRDYSRETQSTLVDLSLAYLNQTENGIIVQLHGFAQDKRKTQHAKEANFIISSGHERALRLPLKFAKCLRQNGFSGVSVFGKDINELGATQNAVKKALYANGFHRFLHIEMSLSQRRVLKASEKQQAKFSQCLNSLVGK